MRRTSACGSLERRGDIPSGDFSLGSFSRDAGRTPILGLWLLYDRPWIIVCLFYGLLLVCCIVYCMLLYRYYRYYCMTIIVKFRWLFILQSSTKIPTTRSKMQRVQPSELCPYSDITTKRMWGRQSSDQQPNGCCWPAHCVCVTPQWKKGLNMPTINWWEWNRKTTIASCSWTTQTSGLIL